MANARGAAFADLAAAAAAGEAGLEGELCALGKGRGYLRGRVEAAEGCAERGCGDGNDCAA